MNRSLESPRPKDHKLLPDNTTYGERIADIDRFRGYTLDCTAWLVIREPDIRGMNVVICNARNGILFLDGAEIPRRGYTLVLSLLAGPKNGAYGLWIDICTLRMMYFATRSVL